MTASPIPTELRPVSTVVARCFTRRGAKALSERLNRERNRRGGWGRVNYAPLAVPGLIRRWAVRERAERF